MPPKEPIPTGTHDTRGGVQGLIESINTKIRLLTRIAFAFHGLQLLIALSRLEVTHHNCQAESEPHVKQESGICA